ncbi:hypothetical protein C8F01DRAFT_640318 [Mycena amicta]|nr:hypothetical protein C8F01DRAFT_640318 [Mycena amicta]
MPPPAPTSTSITLAETGTTTSTARATLTLGTSVGTPTTTMGQANTSSHVVLAIVLGLCLPATVMIAVGFALLWIRKRRRRRKNLNFLPEPFPAESILEKQAAPASHFLLPMARTSSQPMVEELEAHRAAQLALERQNTTLQQQVQMLEVELQLHRDPDMDGSPPEYVDSTSRAGDG